ncbi:MAG: hypothetical protein OEW19_18695 [Acidobacteriota bacterium]|nr:hypothetical protein [Acidobacteriota bacterium]
MPTASRQVGKTLVTRWVSGLRFPQLFTFTAALFVIDFLVPDLIPFLDEILLAAATLLLANLKSKAVVVTGDKPPEKDITPRS